MKKIPTLDTEFQDRLESNPNVLVLGSATSANIDSLRQFFDNNGGAHVIISDISDISLGTHQEKLATEQESPTHFSLLQSDMNQNAITSESINLVLSDFTINFNARHQDSQRFFDEIFRVLKEGGLSIVAIEANRRFKDKGEYGVYQENLHPRSKYNTFPFHSINADQYFLPFSTYMNMAKKSGLEVMAIERRDRDNFGPEYYMELMKPIRSEQQ